jgi:hypothetical protein
MYTPLLTERRTEPEFSYPGLPPPKETDHIVQSARGEVRAFCAWRTC